MNIADLEEIVKALSRASERGWLGNWTMAVEEDGTATLYPLGKWKGKIVLRVRMAGDMLAVLACSPKDWSDCAGEAARDMREAYELVGLYLERYGG